MKMSEQINELAEALAKAQGAVDNAAKASNNPHFKSKYADLAAVREAIREPLSSNGLSYVQFLRGENGAIEIETMLMHKSGQYLADTLRIPLSKNDAQGIGSAASYGRRYALMAVVGIASSEDDDDGNAAVRGNGNRHSPPPPAAPPEPTASEKGTAEEIETAFDSAETMPALEAIRVELAPDIEKLPEPLKLRLRRVYGLKRKVLETFSEAAE
jgi:hypothetical protein